MNPYCVIERQERDVKLNKQAKRLLSGWSEIEAGNEPYKECRFYDNNWCMKGFGECDVCNEKKIYKDIIKALQGDIKTMKSLGIVIKE